MAANPTAHAQASTIAAVCDHLGVAQPAPVAVAYQRLVAQLAAADTLGPPPTALVDAVAAAVDAGRDLATDADVLAAVVRERLVAARPLLIARAGRAYAESVRGELDTLIATWRDAFETAAARLRDAHRVLGDIDLEDSDTVVRLGAAAATAWADARAALATIEHVRRGIAAAALLSARTPNPEHSLLRIANPTDDQRTALRRGRATAWDLIRAGVELDLADHPEHARRIAAAANQPAAV